MSSRSFKSIDLYVASMSAAGLMLTGVLALQGLEATVGDRSAQFWLFTLFMVVGELLPIRVRRKDETEEISISTTFTFALLLSMGTAPAVLAQAIASLLADLSRRKAPWKAAFNVSVYTIPLVVSGLSWRWLSDEPLRGGSALLMPSNVVAVVVAAIAFFSVNLLLTGIAFSLSEGISVREYLRREIPFQGPVDGVLLAVAPVVVVVGQNSLALIPLLALPMAAVYRSADALLENARLVDQLRTQAAEKEHEALHDALTGLPNRTLFRDRVEQAVLAADREGAAAAVMIMDLDRFKEINDTLGHHVGDALLRDVGRRLGGSLRQSDTIARLGGDEFAVLLPKVASEAAAGRAASKVLEALSLPFQVEDMALDIGGSIGVAFFPVHGTDADTLIQRADVAMYAAKELRSGFEFYAQDRDKYSSDRLSLIGELRRAIDDGELVLHYQPKVTLASGDVGGVEALVRWRHPSRGLIPPGEFIELAEHTGLIRPLTLYVVDEAVRQVAQWRRAGLNVGVAVNLSAQNLLDMRLPEEISRILTKWAVSPSALELEITESSIMVDPQRAREVLTRLNESGMQLSIDDFGTGYSSLAYLRQLPVSSIKIDRSFILGMPANENDAVIVRSTVELGRNLGLKVVAEGVETEEIWRLLENLECDVAQGYYLNRPLPSEELTPWLRERATEQALKVKPVPS